MKPTSVILAGLISLSSTQALGVEILVRPSGSDTDGCGTPGDRCATLAFALTQVSGPGDLITLDAGTWSPSAVTDVNVAGADGDPLVIRGAGPSTVIDGSTIPGGPSSNVIAVSADHVTIEDLALIGNERAALILTGAGQTVRGLTVQTTTGNNQPCVLVDAASASRIEGMVVHGCDGAGMKISASVDVTFASSSLYDNGAGGVEVIGSSQIELRGLELHNNNQGAAGTGVALQESDAVVIGADSGGAPTVIAGHTATGIEVLDSLVVTVEHTVLSGNNGAIAITEGPIGATHTDLELSVDHVTIVGNTVVPAFTDTAAGTVLSVTNSIIASNVSGGLGLEDATHHHNIRFDNGAGNLALDATEVELDPLFADAAGGDYHLRSAGGRYTPARFVIDAETSPAIDLADPRAAFDQETSPNGGLANAGAFGNTAQASRTPGALPDAALPDISALDSSLPDAGQPDTAEQDAAVTDVLVPDTGQPDVSGTDSTLPDTSGQDQGSSDTGAGDTGSGARVVARAGADLAAAPPATFALDGSDSTAPADAIFVWTLADSPLGPGAAPVGEGPTVSIELDAVGVFIFQLTVTAGGVSDSDLVVVTLAHEEEAVAEGCGCATNSGAGRPAAGLTLLLLLISGLHRRAAR